MAPNNPRKSDKCCKWYERCRYMRHRLIVVAVMAVCQTISFAAEKTVTGKVSAIDAAKSSITVGDVVLDVGRKTKITVYGKKSTLADINVEQSAKVKYDDDLETAITIDVFKEVSEEETFAALQGTWHLVAEEMNGKRIKKEIVKAKNSVLNVEGNKFTVSTSSYITTGTISLAPDDGPNAIDGQMKRVEGEIKNGKFVVKNAPLEYTTKGIFEVKDQTLRMCFTSSYEKNNGKRPTEFETEEGMGGYCVTYERMAE